MKRMRNDQALAEAEEELKLLEPGSTAYRVAEARFVGLQKAVKEERGKTVEVLWERSKRTFGRRRRCEGTTFPPR